MSSPAADPNSTALSSSSAHREGTRLFDGKYTSLAGLSGAKTSLIAASFPARMALRSSTDLGACGSLMLPRAASRPGEGPFAPGSAKPTHRRAAHNRCPTLLDCGRELGVCSPSIIAMVEAGPRLSRRDLSRLAKHTGIRLAFSMLDLTTLRARITRESPELQRQAAHGPRSARLPALHRRRVCVYPRSSALPAMPRELDAEHIKVACRNRISQRPVPLASASATARLPFAARTDRYGHTAGVFAGYAEVASEIRAFKAICNDAGPRHVYSKSSRMGEPKPRYPSVSPRPGHQALLADGADGPAGTGFIKTSTGKVQPAATMPVTLSCPRRSAAYLDTGCMIGMKLAGGIRISKEALLPRQRLGNARRRLAHA